MRSQLCLYIHAAQRSIFLQRSARAFTLTTKLLSAWTCAECAHSNPLEDDICVRCHMDKPTAPLAPPTPAHLLQWTCACGTANGLLTCTCKSCGKEPPVEEATVEAEGPESQWVCFCGVSNAAESVKCAACGKSTAEMESAQKSNKNNQKEISESADAKETAESTDFWTCQCGASNRAYRSECAVCGDSIDPEVQRRLLDAVTAAEKTAPPENSSKSQKAPGPPERPKDWMCPSCSYSNYGNRLDCRQCGRPKVGQNTIAGKIQLDWVCKACSFSNYANRSKCYRCHRAKVETQFSEASENPQSSPHKPHAALSETPKGQGAPQKGDSADWQCQTCQYVNFRARSDCRRCFTPKGAKTTIAASQKPETEMWPCQCGKENPHNQQSCSFCQLKRPLTHLLPGDWVCQCGIVNYTFRGECFACGLPKEKLRFALTNALSCTLWRCTDCKYGFLQKAASFRCAHCGSPRRVTKAMENWMCPQCKTSNQSDRLFCRGCGAKGGGLFAGNSEKSTWRCVCGNVNLNDREMCLKCGEKREVAEKIEKERQNEQNPWSCACGNTNEWNSQNCMGCQMPKQKAKLLNAENSVSQNTQNPTCAKSAPTSFQRKDSTNTPISTWKCACGASNQQNARVCTGCHRKHKAPRLWYCTECHTFNDLSDAQCIRCAFSQEKAAAALHGRTPWRCKCGNENSGENMICHTCALIRDCPYGQRMPVRSGDWRCACSMVNKCFRARCSHCRVARPLLEWVCHCGRTNKVSETVCGNCESLPGNGSWVCACGFDNFATRVLCHKCAKMRPSEDALELIVKGMEVREKARIPKNLVNEEFTQKGAETEEVVENAVEIGENAKEIKVNVENQEKKSRKKKAVKSAELKGDDASFVANEGKVTKTKKEKKPRKKKNGGESEAKSRSKNAVAKKREAAPQVEMSKNTLASVSAKDQKTLESEKGAVDKQKVCAAGITAKEKSPGSLRATKQSFGVLMKKYAVKGERATAKPQNGE